MNKISPLLVALILSLACLAHAEKFQPVEISASERGDYFEKIFNPSTTQPAEAAEYKLISSFTFTHNDILASVCSVFPSPNDTGPRSSFMVWLPKGDGGKIHHKHLRLLKITLKSPPTYSEKSKNEFVAKAVFFERGKNIFFQTKNDKTQVVTEVGFQKEPFRLLWWKTSSALGTDIQFWKELDKKDWESLGTKMKFSGNKKLQSWKEMNDSIVAWSKENPNIFLVCPELKGLVSKK